MLIVCPHCVSSYRADPDLLQQSGGTVRCARCQRVWTALDPNGEETFPEQIVPRVEVDRPRGVYTDGRVTGLATFVAPAKMLPGDRDSASPLRVIMAAVAVLFFGSGIIGLRKPIVRAVPVMASAYALVGLPVEEPSLTLENVKTAMVREGDTPVLTLDGTVENGRAEVTRVPDIRIVVRDAGAQGLYTWTIAPPKRTLAAGESVTFNSRLVAPPANGHDVQVGFTDARVVVSEAMVKGPR